MVEHTNDTIKPQLGKFSEAFNLPWPIQSSPYSTPQPEVYGKHSLSPYEIVISHHMNLDKGTYESTVLKGDSLHYYYGLTDQLIGTNKLVTFHSVHLGAEHFKDHNVQPGDFCPLEKTLKTLQHCWKGPYQGPKCKWT